MLAVPFVRFRRLAGLVEFLRAIHFHPADRVARLRQRPLPARLQPRVHRLQIRWIGGDVVRQNVEFQNARALQQALQIFRAGDRVLDRIVILVFRLEFVHRVQPRWEIGELFLQIVQLLVARPFSGPDHRN